MFWNEPFFRRPTLNPFRPVARLQDVFEQFWPGAQLAAGETAVSEPPMNIWRQPDRLRLALQLPGVAAEEVELTVEQAELTIRGRRTAPEDQTPAEAAAPQLLRRERRLGEFERRVKLPFPVDAAAVTAQVKHGLLWIDLPRAEADKPRRIEVRKPEA